MIYCLRVSDAMEKEDDEEGSSSGSSDGSSSDEDPEVRAKALPFKDYYKLVKFTAK